MKERILSDVIQHAENNIEKRFQHDQRHLSGEGDFAILTEQKKQASFRELAMIAMRARKSAKLAHQKVILI